ncbi:MAG: methyltransferase domain-containing protein [Campylobacteraceae bacterium]|nr:methyltransferase domain-containing protein [Campylobacteraceae bacterium]
MRFIVQGSSKSWSGDIEHCMGDIDGKPAIYWTIKRIYDNFDNAIVQLIAPEYDTNGGLESLKNDFQELNIFYGYDNSPLQRMIESTKSLDESEYFIRINALNFQFEIDFIKDMMTLAQVDNYDCVKLKDDYPVHFVGEVYKISALKKLKNILSTEDIKNPQYHEVHPKFLLMKHSEFKTIYYTPAREISDKKVKSYLEKMKQVMFIERQIVDDKNKISAGDQLTFHYELAEKFLNEIAIEKAVILDIACGTGYGTIKFDGKGHKVYGADYDMEQINDNKARLSHKKDVIFQHEDIMNLSFDDNTFDIIFSMETIEHVDPNKTLNELKRVLKKDGYLILSTPQNSATGQCVNPVHLYEYSLDEIKNIVSNYFKIEKVIGLKAGKIYFEDDPIGANTVIFAQNI